MNSQLIRFNNLYLFALLCISICTEYNYAKYHDEYCNIFELFVISKFLVPFLLILYLKKDYLERFVFNYIILFVVHNILFPLSYSYIHSIADATLELFISNYFINEILHIILFEGTVLLDFFYIILILISKVIVDENFNNITFNLISKIFIFFILQIIFLSFINNLYVFILIKSIFISIIIDMFIIHKTGVKNG